MLHIPVSQIFIRLSVRFNPKQKTSTFDPFMDLFLYTCPLILWVLSLTVLWWLQQETPCSINTEQWLAQLPRGPVWSSACVLPFNTDKTRSVKEKASLPLLPPSPFSLCSVLYLTSLCPQHISARAEHGGESPSPSLNTLLHSKRHKRKSRQVVAAFPSRTYPVGNLFQMWSGALPHFSHTEDKSCSQNHSSIVACSHLMKFL